MSSSSLTPLCVLLLFAVEWKYACCSGSSENDTASPNFLFMKTLREYLSTTEITLPRNENVRSSSEGSLIATSIETKCSRGKGYSSKGFAIEENNELELEFTISAESGQDKFPEVELWIFPDKTNIPPDNEKIIRYEAEASVAALNRKRTDPGEVIWDTKEDCIQINLTQLSNKIYKRFNRSSINESHVNITVKLQTVQTNLAVHSRDGERSSHHRFCSSLAERATNNSFLFIKNYDETGNRTEMNRKRRSLQNSNSDDTEYSKESCHRKNLEVDLVDVCGTFVKGPRLVDIGDCYGGCTGPMKNSRLFSHHSIVKERLKLQSDRKEIQEYSPCCMPIEFQPLRAHFSLKNKSHVIVQLPDLVVTQCGCR